MEAEHRMKYIISILALLLAHELRADRTLFDPSARARGIASDPQSWGSDAKREWTADTPATREPWPFGLGFQRQPNEFITSARPPRLPLHPMSALMSATWLSHFGLDRL